MKKITDIYCWVGTDPANGEEGVVATARKIDGVLTMLPLSMSNGGDYRIMREGAEQIARITGQHLKLCKFTFVEVLEEIKSAH